MNMIRLLGLLLLAAAAVAIPGCAGDGYKEFYRPAQGVSPELVAQTRAEPPPPVPKLDRSGDKPENVLASYARFGYGLVGYSSFNASDGQSESNAIEQGKRVGADVVVILNPQYTGSRSTVIPLTTPTTQTSYTTGSATAFGSGGSATAYGNATTTTYGSQTTYIPITINRYEYGALYMVKRKYVFGVNVRDLTDAERQHLQRNRGVVVLSVVNGTPAYSSDVLPGDVLLSVNGQPTTDQAAFSNLLAPFKGQAVTFSILRGDQLIEKLVTLNK
jgi:hypothetical protein